MAVAAVAANTKTRQARSHVNHFLTVSDVAYLKYTPATSYSTGGDSIDVAASLPGLVRGTPVLVNLVGNSTTIGWTATYDYTNKKVQLWNGTTEATSSTDYSAKIFDMIVYVP